MHFYFEQVDIFKCKMMELFTDEITTTTIYSLNYAELLFKIWSIVSPRTSIVDFLKKFNEYFNQMVNKIL